MKYFCSMSIFAMTLSSCVTGYQSQFAPTQTSKIYAPRTIAEKIELFRSQIPSKKFEEIGTVNSCCSDDTNILIDELKKKAALSGGDALIGLDIQATGGATASVIRYEN